MSTNNNEKILITKCKAAKRYPKQIKLSAMSELDAGLTKKEVCLKYGMDFSTLRAWIELYGSPDCKNQRVRITDQQRREVARAIMEGRMTIKEAQKEYKIVYASSIRLWIKKMKKENVELTDCSQHTMPYSTSADHQILQELSNARLKIAALETMIDIAEQQFKISIRKKPGAKQF